jgi:hypothetical protein
MSKIVVRGINEMVSNLNSITASQAPFAMAKALTDTAKSASQAVTAHIEQIFDKPTPFTKRAMAFTPANKSELKATVFVKELQASYLVNEMDGGTRGFKTFEEKFSSGGQSPMVALPGRGTELNQYGNISKAKLLRIAREANASDAEKSNNHSGVFIDKTSGKGLPTGVYRRTNNNDVIQLLFFKPRAEYQKKFRFAEVVKENVDENFVKNFQAAWETAIKTKR